MQAKNKAFHEAAHQAHLDAGGGRKNAPGMSSAHLHGNTLYHSTTANVGPQKEKGAGEKKHTLNPTYQATAAHKGCSHTQDGKCAEGGTTGMIHAAHGANVHMKGDRVSSYGLATRPATGVLGKAGKVMGFHEGCTGRPGHFGCKDMLEHHGIHDLNKAPKEATEGDHEKAKAAHAQKDAQDLADHGAFKHPVNKNANALKAKAAAKSAASGSKKHQRRSDGSEFEFYME
jgi:hypothetical protein